MTEVWKDVPGYEGHYQASSLGQIKSLSRKITYKDGRSWISPGRILRWQAGGRGYPQVDLFRDGQRWHAGVHIVVALTFKGPRPSGLQVCHDDGDTQNCAESNLRYDTRAGNMGDLKRHGTLNIGERNGANRLTENDVRQVRTLLAEKVPQTVIAGRFGVCQNAIHRIHAKKTWGWLDAA
jgi:hypothetical protein